MGKLGVMARCGCAIAIACISARNVAAGTVTFDNGVTGAGFTSVTPDDYGTHGFAIGQQYDDEYYPPGVSNPFSPTHLTGPELFITTAGNHTSSVLLTDYKVWADFVENPPPTPDGILADPMHTALARSVTTAIAMTGTNQATSAFRLATDAQGGIRIDVALVQSLTSDAVARSSQLDYVYTFTNNGTVPVSLVLHFMWDSDLFYNGANKDDDDVVGVGPGLCGVYQHDGDPRWSIGLGNGPLSTVPLTYYYGGKDGFVPGSGPAFVPDNAAIGQQYIWLDHGMPAEWQNYVVGPGKNAVGESGSVIGDATIGIEYHFSLAVGASETINARRYYGTTMIPCFVSANCGNGVVDSGELCDGADTPTCNGATCTASACGDGYMNTVAGEQCDSSGVDSETCNGATCLTSACGDGYVNAAAGEDCETGELCDTSTCTFNFSVGGGCAGCGVGGMPDASWLLGGGLLLLRRRRRSTRR
ncbi:MAG TPA: hypothetical protein VFV99_17930 [Kofleriaceae bacterium]|nr:hypothetical protein [Kofleriaceae bacterium]